jgi:NodT family efflux transporter outer membrane factor (OMF) lipoprotein
MPFQSRPMSRRRFARLRQLRRLAAWTCLPLLVSACAAPGMPPAEAPVTPPPGWYAPVPHEGSLSELGQWWGNLQDPVLVELIVAAESVSGSLAQARSRIEQARATRIGAGAALGPRVDGAGNASRGFSQETLGIATIVQGTVQASWETDLFGGNRAARDAAQARFEGAQAQWHDARVSVAAETADRYFTLRSCGDTLAVMRDDANSRAETSRLTSLSADAGFQSPANASLARASSADASARLTQQRAQCDVEVKTLVGLTDLPEPMLRAKLAEPAAGTMAPFTVPEVPAQLLAQRPDVYALERDVAAASADVGTYEAARYPSLRLNGSIGGGMVRTQGVGTTSATWSIGPVELSVPIFDGGRRKADADAARARYEEAVALYRAKVRDAVKEVEQALVNLQAAIDRNSDALAAAEGYRLAFVAAEASYRSGLGSLIEMEDVRRTALAAQMNVVTLQRERISAWISLYRAMGGGWSRPDSSPNHAGKSPQ